MLLHMRTLLKTIPFIISAIIFCYCEKEEPAPNENWVIGGKWIDTRDGHSYATVPIGNQIWMAENMAFLPSVNNVDDGSEDQGKKNDPFYYVYNYNGTDVAAAKETSNYEDFGVLYNWTAAKNACPDDWHLPTDLEWMELEIYLGMSANMAGSGGLRGTDEGSKIKSTWSWEFITWYDKYGNGTNETGFTALPGGDRYLDYTDYTLSTYKFYSLGSSGYWWSASKGINSVDNIVVWSRALSYSSDKVYRIEAGEEEAQSVRCIKDK